LPSSNCSCSPLLFQLSVFPLNLIVSWWCECCLGLLFTCGFAVWVLDCHSLVSFRFSSFLWSSAFAADASDVYAVLFCTAAAPLHRCRTDPRCSFSLSSLTFSSVLIVRCFWCHGSDL
jgi:hypothetical protein